MTVQESEDDMQIPKKKDCFRELSDNIGVKQGGGQN